MSAPDAPPMVIDGGDRTCVALLIELRGHITRLEPGTVIHLIASDPAAPIDLARLVPPHRPRLPRPGARITRGTRLRAAHQRRLSPDPAVLALAAHP